jgi:hypothetical protein
VNESWMENTLDKELQLQVTPPVVYYEFLESSHNEA